MCYFSINYAIVYTENACTGGAMAHRFTRSVNPFGITATSTFFLPSPVIRSPRRYPASTDSTPMAAPATTSPQWWRLRLTRSTAVTVATVNPATLIHGLTLPNSLCSMAAPQNAIDVWPDGNEWSSVPSGRVECIVCFSPYVTPALITNDAAEFTSSRFHELWASTPAAFST